MLTDGLHTVPPGHLAAVVTYLERTDAPAPAPPPPPGVAIASWSPDVAAYRALFRAVGAPWLWSSRLEEADAEVAAILADPLYETRRVTRAGVPVGMLDLDLREPGACEIAFLGLVPDAVGAGLGRALMDHALARAFRDGPVRVHVHTCTLDAPGALAFYVRSGFRAVRREVEVMADPRGALLPADASPAVPRL